MRSLWDVKRLKDGIVLVLVTGDEVLEVVLTDEEMHEIVRKWGVPDWRIRAGNFSLAEEAKRGS